MLCTAPSPALSGSSLRGTPDTCSSASCPGMHPVWALRQNRQLAFHELCALYAVTDVALVTSLRDGMNLVSYEYVACQSDNAGARASLVGPMHAAHHARLCVTPHHRPASQSDRTGVLLHPLHNFSEKVLDACSLLVGTSRDILRLHAASNCA